MAKYIQGISRGTSLWKETVETIRPLFENEDFCLRFRIDPKADEDTKIAQLRYFYLEWHDPSQFHSAVLAFGDIMLYRRSRSITGTLFFE